MGLEKRIARTEALFDDNHWDLFAEFTELEMASGGPDPHVSFSGELAKHLTLEEKIWFGGCYISAYNVASAAVFYRDWPYNRIFDESMLPWLYEHWNGITTRTERKGVRIKENMATFFDDYANWELALLSGEKTYLLDKTLTPVERYEELWDDVTGSVKYLGRYVAIKLLEYFKRYCGFDIELPDVRPIEGWSPRTTLALLYPDRIQYMLTTDSKDNLRIINETADEALYELQTTYGLREADHFTLEVALCNYRQSYVGRKLYPGRTHDTELGYYNKIIKHWENYPGYTTDLNFKAARAAIYPHEHLSELNGNWGVRSKEIGRTTREGFIWSDLLYDYNTTSQTGNFRNPVVWPDADSRLDKAFELRAAAMHHDFNLEAVMASIELPDHYIERDYVATLAGPARTSSRKTSASVYVNEMLPKAPHPDKPIQPISTSMVANELAPGELYQRGQFIDKPLDTKLGFLKKYGITVIVNMWHKVDEAILPYVKQYHHFHFPDSENDPIREAELLAKASELADLIDAGEVVLIHCYGGNNRSGLLAALTLRELYSMTGEEALNVIKSHKARALHNEKYANYLKELPAL